MKKRLKKDCPDGKANCTASSTEQRIIQAQHGPDLNPNDAGSSKTLDNVYTVPVTEGTYGY